MSKNTPFIHQFKTRRGNYIYDVNTNRILRVKEEAYEEIKKFYNGEEAEGCSYVDKMRKDGFLSSHRFSEIVHPHDELLEQSLQHRVNMVILQITQQCNLRCKYCPYSGSYNNRSHSNKRMTFDIAKKAIDFLIANSSERQMVAIGFYGGEPLIEFDFIKKCVEYAEKVGEGKEILFTTTSNATLLNKEMVDFFDKHDFDVVVSLDGPEKVHDKNRDLCNGKGSFETVMKNIEMVKNEFPEFFKKISFNCVMDPENDFSCINEFFTTYEAVKESVTNFNSLNMAYSKVDSDSYNEDFYIKYDYELFKLFLSRINRVNKDSVAKMVEDSYRNLKLHMYDSRKIGKMGDKGHHGGPCIPGGQRLFVNIHGDFYPCERVSEESKEMVIGNINEGFNVEQVRKLLNIGKLTEEKCKNCWSFRFCHLCAVAADDLDCLSAEKKVSRCGKIQRDTEYMFKTYCTLMELGDDYQDDLEIINY